MDKNRHLRMEKVLEDLVSVVAETVPDKTLTPKSVNSLGLALKELTKICEETHKSHQAYYEDVIVSWSELDYARFAFIMMSTERISSHWLLHNYIENFGWIMCMFKTFLIGRVVEKTDPFTALEQATTTPEQMELAQALTTLSIQSQDVHEKERLLVHTLELLRNFKGLSDQKSFEFKFVAAGLYLFAKKPSRSGCKPLCLLEKACLYFTEDEPLVLDEIVDQDVLTLLNNLGLNERGLKVRSLMKSVPETTSP
jgi:hypothetical protein